MSVNELLLTRNLSDCIYSQYRENTCPICYCREDVSRVSLPDSCCHLFCTECLQEAAKVNHLCPLCNTPYASIISFNDYIHYLVTLVLLKDEATLRSPQVKHRLYGRTFDYIQLLRHSNKLNNPFAFI